MSTHPTVEPPKLLRVPEVARRLDVCRDTVYWLIARGDIPAVRLGGSRSALRVPADELAAWLLSEEDDAV